MPASLQSRAEELGVTLESRQVGMLQAYLGLLETWSARTNLVSRVDRHDPIERHLLDSMAAAPLLGLEPSGCRVGDIGSGAGLPGVVLAIALPHIRVGLVESRRKRASFLRAVARELPELELEVLEGRAEDVPPARFDAAVTRAAFRTALLTEIVTRLVRPGGLVIAYRSDRDGGPGEPAGSRRIPAGAGHHLLSWRA